jgi:hypothetical protein
LRRIKEEFRERSLTGASIQEVGDSAGAERLLKLAQAQEMLALIRRQATIASLYPSPELVVEKDRG